MKTNVIDLFSGCGGLVDGFLQAKDFNTLAAVDWEQPTVTTLQKRLCDKWGYELSQNSVLHFDIQRTKELLLGYEDQQFGKNMGLVDLVGNRSVDLIIGGPPCQAYSMAGRVRDKNGMQNDYRNYLFESYIEVVKHFQPKAFVFENVEGILSAQPGGKKITDRIRESFDKAGYEIIDNLRQNALFDTSYYEVPQRRKRVIILGVLKSNKSAEMVNNFYSVMRNKERKQEEVSNVAFERLPKFYPSKSLNNKRQSHSVRLSEQKCPMNHEPRFHNERDIDIFRILAQDIQDGVNKYNNVKALIELYKEKTGKVSKFHKYNVIKLDKPSNTIPAHLYKDGLRHIHPDPEQARTITVREAARLQSFDDDFEFLGARGDQYKMVGNAVPPKFAKIIAETVLEIL